MTQIPPPDKFCFLFMGFQRSAVPFAWEIWISSFPGKIIRVNRGCSVLPAHHRLELNCGFSLRCSCLQQACSLVLQDCREPPVAAQSHLKGSVRSPPLTLERAPVFGTIAGVSSLCFAGWALLPNLSLRLLKKKKKKKLKLNQAIHFHVKVKWDGKREGLTLEPGTEQMLNKYSYSVPYLSPHSFPPSRTQRQNISWLCCWSTGLEEKGRFGSLVWWSWRFSVI